MLEPAEARLGWLEFRRGTGLGPSAQRRELTTLATAAAQRCFDAPGTELQEADRFFGTTVHYAARVARQAPGGEVLVSNLVRELVANSGVQFTESREVELKGLDGAHRLFAVDLTDR